MRLKIFRIYRNDPVQRLGLLAMAHLRPSTPMAGVEAVLGISPLDLFTQCISAQVAFRIQGRNKSSWDGIDQGHLRGHLFWCRKLLEQVNLGDGLTIGKRSIRDLFHDRWRVRWKHLHLLSNKVLTGQSQ